MDANGRTQIVEIEPDSGKIVTFYNDPDQILTIQKYAGGTTNPIQGSVFLIKDSGGNLLGNNNGEFTTGRNGQIILSGLTAGMTVTAQEIQAADGYTLDGSLHSIQIKKGSAQTLTVYNTPKKTLVINKFIEGTATPVPGVRFEITDGNGGKIGAGEYVTNENGQIILSNLDAGMTVIAREVKTVRGYALNASPQSTVIQADGANNLTFYDLDSEKFL